MRGEPSPMSNPDTADFVFENHRIIWLCQPTNTPAREHLLKHCPGSLWYAGALVCEPRYVLDLAMELTEDGFTTEV